MTFIIRNRAGKTCNGGNQIFILSMINQKLYKQIDENNQSEIRK